MYNIFAKYPALRLRNICGVSLMAGLCSIASAQTVTVNPAGTANGISIFNNLQDAVNSFVDGAVNSTADPGNTIPNIINLRSDNGPIIGKMVAIGNNANPVAPVLRNIVGDVTIQGINAAGDPALAVFAGDPLSNTEQNIRKPSTGPGGLPRLAWTQSYNLTLKNIAFIPNTLNGDNSPESFIAVKAPAMAGVNVAVNIENCVFTSNDGTGAPITTTGLPADDAKLDLPGTLSLPQGSAGIWAFSRVERGDLVLNVKNSVVASVTKMYGAAPRFEFVKGWANGTAPHKITFVCNILEGCRFANLEGNICQITYGGYINLKGTESNPIIVRDLKLASAPAAVWLAYIADADDQPVAADLEYVKFFNCACPGILENGARAFVNSIKNCKFVNCGDAVNLRSGTNLDSTGVGKPDITVDNCVFHNCGTPPGEGVFYGGASATRPLNITNSYFTDSDATSYAFNGSSTAVWTMASSTLSLTGSSALAGIQSGTVAPTIDPSCNNNEVIYANTTDVYSSDFYKVTSKIGDWTIY